METCLKYTNCSIFQKTIAVGEQNLRNFKNSYCKASKDAYSQCANILL